MKWFKVLLTIDVDNANLNLFYKNQKQLEGAIFPPTKEFKNITK